MIPLFFIIRQIVESTDSEEGKWELVFSLCARDDDEYDTEDARKDYQNLVLSVQSSLKNIGMAIPANFDLIMFEGFPCQCLRSCPSMKNRTKVCTTWCITVRENTFYCPCKSWEESCMRCTEKTQDTDTHTHAACLIVIISSYC